MKQLTPEDEPTLTQLDISTLIALADKPMHGYGIAERVAADIGCGSNKVTPGTIYKVLNRLEEYDYVQVCETRLGTSSPFQRKLFDLTIAGTSVLELACESQINQASLGLHRLMHNRTARR